MKVQRVLALGFLVALLSTGQVFAAPAIKQGKDGFTITEGVTDEFMVTMKEGMSKVTPGKLAFSLSKVSDADLEKICTAYPDMTALILSDCKEITTFAPLANLKKLTYVKISKVAAKDIAHLANAVDMSTLIIESDFEAPDLQWMSNMAKLASLTMNCGKGGKLSSLEGLPAIPGQTSISITGEGMVLSDLTPLVKSMPNLKKLDLRYAKVSDLSALAQLADLRDLSLYGATVQDFSPLAACPKLEKVCYYAAKCDDFSSLGKLTQVNNLEGGLTRLSAIDWVENLPNLKSFQLFSEDVSDYSPLTKTNIENLTIWSMKKPVGDLSFLSGMGSLKKLKIWSVEDATNFDALGNIATLEELDFVGVHEKKGDPVDFSFISKMSTLTSLNITGTNGFNFDAIGSAPAVQKFKLHRINEKSESPVDIGFVGKMPSLASVDLASIKVGNLEGLAASPTITHIQLGKDTGITDLSPLKKMAKLDKLGGVKGKFPDDQTQGFPSTVKIQ